MFGLGLTEILAFVLLGVLFAIKCGGPKKNLPPGKYRHLRVRWEKILIKNVTIFSGPRGLPIVGSVFQLTNNAHLQMTKWAKEYGKIYKFKMGTNT